MELFGVYMNFLTILTLLTIITGIITAFEFFYLRKARTNGYQPSFFIRHAKEFFPIFLFVLILRGFLYEGYRIPSGSLEPTLLVGDIILVNKYEYGLRAPWNNNILYAGNKPQRGEIVVFEWPVNRQVYMIKRVVGVPGDHVVYKNGILWINGQKISHEFVKNTVEGSGHSVELRAEDLLGVKHNIYYIEGFNDYSFDVVVPNDHYFMLGDNRSLSADSRAWGFMPDSHIVGRAEYVVASWDNSAFNLRYRRTFNAIN